MKISKSIIERRKALGISQKALADMAGIRQATLCDFEINKKSMGSKTIDIILEILKLKIQPSQPQK